MWDVTEVIQENRESRQGLKVIGWWSHRRNSVSIENLTQKVVMNWMFVPAHINMLKFNPIMMMLGDRALGRSLSHVCEAHMKGISAPTKKTPKSSLALSPLCRDTARIRKWALTRYRDFYRLCFRLLSLQNSKKHLFVVSTTQSMTLCYSSPN